MVFCSPKPYKIDALTFRVSNGKYGDHKGILKGNFSTSSCKHPKELVRDGDWQPLMKSNYGES